MSTRFFSEQLTFKLRRQKRIINWLENSASEYNYHIHSLNYIFCSNEYLIKLNQKYLRHENYTDIITFGYSDANKPIEADIYISIEQVKLNAKEYKSLFYEELHRVLVHGLLHLCGMKDSTSEQKKMMRMAENHQLKKLKEKSST